MRSTSPGRQPADQPAGSTRRSHPEFSDRTLAQLLDALRARTTGHPDNPGLIACWPGVPESRMAAACRELQARGEAVFQTPVVSSYSVKPRDGWTIAGPTDEPAL